VGRPREHDDATARALLDAAERIMVAGGPEAVSVRAVADDAGTTVRAVYSLYGSKDGLVSALAARAYLLLADEIDALARTDDPAADLVELAVSVYRCFVLEHPALYRVAFQRVSDLRLTDAMAAARRRAALRVGDRVQRLKDTGALGGKSVHQAGIEFNAMCEGLANAELRGGTVRLLPVGGERASWRAAAETLMRGFRAGARDPAVRPA
jgi:AcrR family transcriptional regulator